MYIAQFFFRIALQYLFPTGTRLALHTNAFGGLFSTLLVMNDPPMCHIRLDCRRFQSSSIFFLLFSVLITGFGPSPHPTFDDIFTLPLGMAEGFFTYTFEASSSICNQPTHVLFIRLTSLRLPYYSTYKFTRPLQLPGTLVVSQADSSSLLFSFHTRSLCTVQYAYCFHYC